MITRYQKYTYQNTNLNQVVHIYGSKSVISQYVSNSNCGFTLYKTVEIQICKCQINVKKEETSLLRVCLCYWVSSVLALIRLSRVCDWLDRRSKSGFQVNLFLSVIKNIDLKCLDYISMIWNWFPFHNIKRSRFPELLLCIQDICEGCHWNYGVFSLYSCPFHHVIVQTFCIWQR